MLYPEQDQTRALGLVFLHSDEAEVFIPDIEFLDNSEPQVVLRLNDTADGVDFPDWELLRSYLVGEKELEILKRHAEEYRQKQFSTPEKTQSTLHFHVLWLSVDASNHCKVNIIANTGERLFSVRVKNEDLDTFMALLEDGIRACKKLREERFNQLPSGTSAPNTTN